MHSCIVRGMPPDQVVTGTHDTSRNVRGSEPQTVHDEGGQRRAANRALALSAVGLGATGLLELALAVLTHSVGLLSDALHNLSDVSTSALVFFGFRISRRPASARFSGLLYFSEALTPAAA